MKTASIISVGSELMKGKMDDTNSTYISRWLHIQGVEVKWRMSAGDNIDEIVKALSFTKESDIVVLTGGLGPTDDDCTREAVSKYLNKKLELNDKMWKIIHKMFLCYNYKHTPQSNKKQAMLIDGGEFIRNKRGSAPGMFIKNNNKYFVLLPGPPNENRPLLDEYLYEKLKSENFFIGDIYTEIIRTYTMGESTLADLLKGIKTTTDIGFYFSQEGWIELHVSKKGTDLTLNKREVKNTFKKIKQILDENDVFYTANIDLGLLLLNSLKKKGFTISFAESITGGYLSAEFIKNPGASECLRSSNIVYSNQSKIEVLNVNKHTIEKYGAVSKEAAEEMVKGLKNISGSNICVSVTGIAGPTGGSKEKPVGLVHLGFMFDNELILKKEIFSGSRIRIIKRCVNYVFIEILKKLIY